MDAYTYSILAIYLTFTFTNTIQTKTSVLPTAVFSVDKEMCLNVKISTGKDILLSGQVCPTKRHLEHALNLRAER